MCWGCLHEFFYKICGISILLSIRCFKFNLKLEYSSCTNIKILPKINGFKLLSFYKSNCSQI